jgi:hypothetical protein
MKYLLLTLLLAGCTFKSDTDKDIEELKKQIEQNDKRLVVIHCETGVLFTFTTFRQQLQGKVTDKQINEVWAKCEALGK